MARLIDHAKALARVVSPRHRRWQELQESLDHVPERGALDLQPDDFIICGCPRTGTALLTAQLFRPPEIITVMEPWDGLRMSATELVDSLREELLETGRLTRGRLDVEALQREATVSWLPEGDKVASIEAQHGFRIGVKWPTFWQYLDLMPRTKFLVCLRDPAEVVESFEREGARLRNGYDYDVPFNTAMNRELAQISDPLHRRIAMYDYINSRILPHLDRPEVLAVRYERWFGDPGALLAEISGFLSLEAALVSQVEIRTPKANADDLRVVEAVRDHCETAQPLGYSP